MASLLASLLIKLGLDAAEVKPGLTVAERDLKAATRRIENIGKNMVGVGQKLSQAVTLPIIAMGGLAVQGALDQRKAMAQVEAALASMGNVAGRTATQLEKNADALELDSLFDADVILTKVTANLLTFGNVAGEVFDRAQQSAIDMAQRMGGDPQSAAIMLGKALNDPIKGITALTRVGVQFTEQQKAQIKAFQETGETAKAQGIILSEVERQFKGAAKAAADASPWRRAEVQINQAMDKIGEAILPIIPVIAGAVESLAKVFSGLSPEMQKTVIIGGAVAAALGPVAFIMGTIVSAAAPLVAAFTTVAAASTAAGAAATGASGGFAALAAAAAPWIAVAAALAGVGYLIYENWDKIKPVLQGVWKTISDTLGPPLQAIVDTVSTMFRDLWDGPLGDGIREAGARLASFGAAVAQILGPALLGTLKLALTVISNVLNALLELGRGIGSLFRGEVGEALGHFAKSIDNLFGGLPGKVIGWVAQMVRGIGTWMLGRLNAIWENVRGKIEAVQGWFFGLYDAVVGHSYIPDMVDEIGQHMRRLDGEMVTPAKKSAEAAKEAFRALQETVAGILAELYPELAEKMRFDDMRSKIDAFYDAEIAKAKATKASKDELLRIDMERLKVLDDLDRKQKGLEIVDPSKVVPVSGKSIEEMSEEASSRIGDAFEKVGKKAEVTKVQVIESFSQMIDGALNQIDRFVRGIKSGNWLDIIGGLLNAIDGIAAAFTGGKGTGIGPFTFGNRSGSGTPPYANGTNFHPGGLAIVGERGRELVNLPRGSQVKTNRELNAMMAASGSGELVVRLEKDGEMSAYFEGLAGRVVDAKTPAIAKGATSAAMRRMGRLQQKSIG